MIVRYICIIFFLTAATTYQALAQESRLTGIIADSTDNTTLIGVSVVLQQANDSTQRKGAVTDIDGRFTFTNVAPGRYVLKYSYIGYTTRQRTVAVREPDTDLGTITLAPGVTTLRGVEIKGAAIQVEQKGDTLQYNANAFKVNRDAVAEDLIGKMPGITVDNTGVKAQGDAVQQVLVDGKVFFGDDASLALKNLPAEIIDKIEVFDRLSEQSQFTGFDDGNTRKTINIVTKKGRNNGQFGRVYAGIGEDGRYTAGGNINSFKGDRKLSLVGLSNNINQQNFSNEDLLGVSSSSGGGGGGGGRGGRGGRGGGGGGNFNVGQQGGISTTHSVGLNYADRWGKKTDFTASYFFNTADNENLTSLNRTYITNQDSGLVYSENSRSNSRNYNHRINARIEHTIDTANSLVITPRLSFQTNDARSSLAGDYTTDNTALESHLTNQRRSDNDGYNLGNSILYRHRFAKRGRSFSVNLNTEASDRNGDSEQYALTEYASGIPPKLVDQQSDQHTRSATVSSDLSYTEPISRFSQVQLNYTPAYTRSTTDKETFNLGDGGVYNDLDTTLTNTFENSYISHQGGASYRFNNRKLSAMGGVNFQYSHLQSDQDFPFVFAIDRSFQQLLPRVMLNYKFSQTENIRVMYRTSTNAPSISQLQRVPDNSNTLFLTTGNPNLGQDFTHSLTVRYSRSNTEKSTSLLFLLSGSFINDYITNATYIARTNETVNGVELSQGVQLSYPVNMNGYRNARALFTYGTPLSTLKINMNLNTSLNYNRIPALINEEKNIANNYALSQGIVLSSNISENFDFTLSYNANYTIVKNTLQQNASNNPDNNYFNQVTSLRLNWIFLKHFVFTSTANNTLYRGLSAAYDQSIWFWNAGLGYKFLKNDALEVKVNAYDILNNNSSISRDITQTYIEDRQTNVLNRYFLLTLTYTLRNFKA
jgi:hypothetical protein